MSGPTMKLILAWERSGTGNDLEHVASVECGGQLRTWRIVQKRGSGRYRLFLDGEKFGADDTASRLKSRAEAETASRDAEASGPEPDPAPQTVAGDPAGALGPVVEYFPLGYPSDEEPTRVTPVEDPEAWSEPVDLTAAAYRAAGLTDPDDETKEEPPLPPDEDGNEAYRRRAMVAREMAAECSSPTEKAVWEAEAEDAEWHFAQAAGVPVAADSPSGV